MIHFVETGDRPEDGEIVRAKCGKELEFRPISPLSERFIRICGSCNNKRSFVKIPIFLAVPERVSL